MKKFVLLEIHEEAIYDEETMMDEVKNHLKEMWPGNDPIEHFEFTEIPVKLFHIRSADKSKVSTGLYAVGVDPETLTWKRIEA